MAGKTELGGLLRKMQPKLAEGEYYVASVGEGGMMSLAGYLRHILCVFREEEGLTVVFDEAAKDAIGGMSNGKIAGPFALITLGVQSDLLSVGLLARITPALASRGISCNAYSAYHHDHLLVPYGKRNEALASLAALQKEKK